MFTIMKRAAAEAVAVFAALCLCACSLVSSNAANGGNGYGADRVPVYDVVTETMAARAPKRATRRSAPWYAASRATTRTGGARVIPADANPARQEPPWLKTLEYIPRPPIGARWIDVPFSSLSSGRGIGDRLMSASPRALCGARLPSAATRAGPPANVARAIASGAAFPGSPSRLCARLGFGALLARRERRRISEMPASPGDRPAVFS